VGALGRGRASLERCSFLADRLRCCNAGLLGGQPRRAGGCAVIEGVVALPVSVPHPGTEMHELAMQGCDFWNFDVTA
jgi:hypothetical protein